MEDSDFKSLAHVAPVGAVIDTRGCEVIDGYKPDVTVLDGDGKPTFILECETKTDRKAFLGDLVKADRYAYSCDASPSLVIVMQVKENTTVSQIGRHLEPYATWLDARMDGGLRLRGIFVISDDEYLNSVNSQEPLGSERFQKRSHVVKS